MDFCFQDKNQTDAISLVFNLKGMKKEVR